MGEGYSEKSRFLANERLAMTTDHGQADYYDPGAESQKKVPQWLSVSVVKKSLILFKGQAAK
jgi:hypothetical protein